MDTAECSFRDGLLCLHAVVAAVQLECKGGVKQLQVASEGQQIDLELGPEEPNAFSQLCVLPTDYYIRTAALEENLTRMTTYISPAPATSDWMVVSNRAWGTTPCNSRLLSMTWRNRSWI